MPGYRAAGPCAPPGSRRVAPRRRYQSHVRTPRRPAAAEVGSRARPSADRETTPGGRRSSRPRQRLATDGSIRKWAFGNRKASFEGWSTCECGRRFRSSLGLDERLPRHCQTADEGGSPVAWRWTADPARRHLAHVDGRSNGKVAVEPVQADTSVAARRDHRNRSNQILAAPIVPYLDQWLSGEKSSDLRFRKPMLYRVCRRRRRPSRKGSKTHGGAGGLRWRATNSSKSLRANIRRRPILVTTGPRFFQTRSRRACSVIASA